MIVPTFRNVNTAFVGMLERVLADGQRVDSRNGPTIELTSQVITIEHPVERFVYAPGRNANPFAAIGESLWVLAGRNDLAYLTPYLKRAPDFSDDGEVWRAGYGPRLRAWHGVDQVAAAHSELTTHPDSRRAALVLFDPSMDNVDSLDVPCNNWMHFLPRNGQLDLSVAARSTDIWWGLSGINLFEWSVLLEMMARWLGLNVGRLTFFTSSLHLYAEREKQARAVLDAVESVDGYVSATTARYDTDWAHAGALLDRWMNLELQLRRGSRLEELDGYLGDPMLDTYLRAIDIYWRFHRGADAATLQPELEGLGDNDVASVASEFLHRDNARSH